MKLWPTRAQAEKENIDPVADLDSIVSERISFRLKGKIHWLEPVSVEEFLKYCNAHARLMKFLAEETEGPLTAKDLAKKYHAVVESVCKTITIEDIMGMEQAQIAALFQLVIDRVTGQVNMGDGKKKRLRLPIYDYVGQSSSQSVESNSAGSDQIP